ncbi:hypothetical protein B0181_06760 [Moraxella caviae]|uniref:5-carboxymethyl-2-hydroxymuconate isomerase n=1 Tax=Moraxella caviae TaxID=34060 RepID=A0A1T0A289_9GAMM|nr:5-carboxymethyl-2-hydroxymuconate Delta-isomerase [Moraxella caviae]OOR89381.1 hypothetical protein B0181_06760 [Moraxella caviae]STZ09897.1 5-carboxymethyl-2-hydroxymuconate isomerase [Moraxella caviae]
MPHVVIELSENLPLQDGKALLKAVNETLFASGEFRAAKDIKSRIYRAPVSLIGLGEAGDGEHFVVAKIALLAGRSDDVKSALVGRVMTVLQAHFADVADVQYAVEIQDLSAQYLKA